MSDSQLDRLHREGVIASADGGAVTAPEAAVAGSLRCDPPALGTAPDGMQSVQFLRHFKDFGDFTSLEDAKTQPGELDFERS